MTKPARDNTNPPTLRDQWESAMAGRAVACIPEGGYETVSMYRGRPITNDWPDESHMRRDIAFASGEKDVSDPAVTDAWIRCADGRTLMEYAKGGVR